MELGLDSLVERFKDCKQRCYDATEGQLHNGPSPWGVAWIWNYQANSRREVLVKKCVDACNEMGASCPTAEGIRLHFKREEERDAAAAKALVEDESAYTALKKSKHFTWFGLRPNKPIPGSLEEFRTVRRLERQASGEDDGTTQSYFGRGGGSGSGGAAALQKCETSADHFIKVLQSVSLRPSGVAFDQGRASKENIKKLQDTSTLDLLQGAATDVYNHHAAKYGAETLTSDVGRRTATGDAFPEHVLPDGAKAFLDRKDKLEAGMSMTDAEVSAKLKERKHFVNGVHVLEGVTEDEFRAMPIREVMKRVQEQGRQHEEEGGVHGTRPF